MLFRIMLLLAAILAATVAAAAAETVTYRKHIQPIVAARCAGCHGSEAPEYFGFKEQKEAWIAKGIGPRMDTYSHLVYFTAWPDTGALMRRLDDAKPGNMYQHLGDNDEERKKNLALFKAWVGNWSLKKWAEISKEEMDGIKVPY
jgi:hypothetical protein